MVALPDSVGALHTNAYVDKGYNLKVNATYGIHCC